MKHLPMPWPARETRFNPPSNLQPLRSRPVETLPPRVETRSFASLFRGYAFRLTSQYPESCNFLAIDTLKVVTFCANETLESQRASMVNFALKVNRILD
jgi:hypothetical protein